MVTFKVGPQNPSQVLINAVTGNLKSWYGTCPVTRLLRLAAPPSISDSLLAPLVNAFQAPHPDVRVQIMITERIVD
ncbi:MAG: LysR substrate-binding domain-containing protein, partial [Candidatus Acidiferrales bacterium]